MQTKFKDIAQYYLGTGLEVECHSEQEIQNEGRYISTIVGINEAGIDDNFGNNWDFSVKPLLRSLDSLTKPITVKGYNDDKEFVPIYHLLQEYCFDTDKMDEDEVFYYSDSMINVDISFGTVKLLCSWHFNIFGLEETEYIKID